MLDSEVSELLKLLNEGFPRVHEMTGEQARAAVAARRQPVTNLDDVRGTEEHTFDTGWTTLRVRVYHPHGQPPHPVVVFFHGGGFVFCDLDTHDGFCRAMSRHTGALVVSVDYRLAPEHRAPAAAHDADAAVRWAARNAARFGGDPARLVVAGDSAGGNLAAVACLLSRDHDGPPIAGQVLAYPVIDPSFDTDSYRRYGDGYYNTEASMRWYWTQYLGEGLPLPSPRHLVAPLRAPGHADLPAAVVVTAGLDPLRDEGHAYAKALREAGGTVVHRDYPGLFHGFLTFASLRAAESARRLLWRDMRSLLDAGGR